MIPEPGNAVVTTSSTSWVSVAELLDRRAAVQASEAVAVVAELCAVLIGRDMRVIPHPSDVLINGDGKLAIRTQDEGDSSPSALGRLLHSLCATASPSAPLRLFMSVATSSDRYESVSAFADALTTYEVPGRDKLIQGLHDRWVAARTAAGTAAVEIPLRAEPEPEPEKKPKSKATAHRLPRWAIAAAGLAVILGGSASAWLATGAQAPSLPPISVASISFASISSSVESAIQQASAWIAGTPSQVAAAEPEVATKPARARRRSATTRVGTSAPDATPGILAGEAAAAMDATSVGATNVTDGLTLTTTLAGDDTSAPAGTGTAAVAGSAETAASVDDFLTAVDDTVYSRAYAGVMPPVMTTRQIASPGVLSPEVEAISTIEVVIDESGDVQNVKLLSRPSPILATMLLSAAKTWKFRPALHDGRPVKYRLRLDVATTRP